MAVIAGKRRSSVRPKTRLKLSIGMLSAYLLIGLGAAFCLFPFTGKAVFLD